MQLEYPLPTPHHKQIHLYIVDSLQRNSTSRQFKISAAAVACIYYDPSGFEAASVHCILSNSMNANSVATDAVDQLTPPFRVFYLSSTWPCPANSPGVPAKSGTFDRIFSACHSLHTKGFRER